MEPFAYSGDLELRWRTLTEDEAVRADVRLGEASRLVRDRVGDVDARIASGELDPLTVTDVVCGVVRRAMSPRVSGAESSTTAVGAVSQSITYSNPDGDLYLTSSELARLSTRVSRRAFSISTLPAP